MPIRIATLCFIAMTACADGEPHGTEAIVARTDTIAPDPGGEPPRAYIVVHADPDDANWVNWGYLRDFIERADAGGHRITIELAADWGQLIRGVHPDHRYDPASTCLRDPAAPCALEELATWVARGHRLGFHHHDCSHAEPDRYYDPAVAALCGKVASPAGTVRDAFFDVHALQAELTARGVPAAAARIAIAGQGPDEGAAFRIWEWRPGVDFATGPVVTVAGGTFLGTPRCIEVSNDGGATLRTIAEGGTRQLAVGDFGQHGTLAQLVDDLELARTAAGAPVIGIVFHAHEYTRLGHGNPTGFADDRTYIDQVLEALEGAGIAAEPAIDVLASVPCH